jgi:hypothetical protein
MSSCAGGQIWGARDKEAGSWKLEAGDEVHDDVGAEVEPPIRPHKGIGANLAGPRSDHRTERIGFWPPVRPNPPSPFP